MIVDKSESVPVPGVMVVTQSHISGSVSRKHYQLPTYQHCLGCLSLRTRSHHMWDVRRLPACRQSPLSLGMSRLLTRILSLSVTLSVHSAGVGSQLKTRVCGHLVPALTVRVIRTGRYTVVGRHRDNHCHCLAGGG